MIIPRGRTEETRQNGHCGNGDDDGSSSENPRHPPRGATQSACVFRVPCGRVAVGQKIAGNFELFDGLHDAPPVRRCAAHFRPYSTPRRRTNVTPISSQPRLRLDVAWDADVPPRIIPTVYGTLPTPYDRITIRNRVRSVRVWCEETDMSAPTDSISTALPGDTSLWVEPALAILSGLLALEIAVFAVIGTNFLSLANAFEVLRLSVEIGLLAVALTPVITTGGIDLSVGSLMGLSAVVFGKLWRDGGLPIGAAAAVTLVLGALAGSLNGVLITRGRIPALIVTLGSFSLFRGLAEGLTGGVDNFTHFPEQFLFLGQGYSLAGVPTQVPIFVVVAAAFWVLLHRTTIGRGLVAIGFSPEGARYAGLPVERLVGLVYVLSGLVASLAAIIYVAHLGQAKADAGTGYELAAITAVVLGGTSIFGGRGSVPGTLLGLFAIAVLQNGLRLADLPAELAGVLTGTLLLVAIGLDRKPAPDRAAGAAHIRLWR